MLGLGEHGLEVAFGLLRLLGCLGGTRGAVERAQTIRRRLGRGLEGRWEVAIEVAPAAQVRVEVRLLDDPSDARERRADRY